MTDIEEEVAFSETNKSGYVTININTVAGKTKVRAKEIFLPDIEGYRFFVHQTINDVPWGEVQEEFYCVTELETGFAVISDVKGERACIQEAYKLARNKKQKKFDTAILKCKKMLTDPFYLAVNASGITLTVTEQADLKAALIKYKFTHEQV